MTVFLGYYQTIEDVNLNKDEKFLETGFKNGQITSKHSNGPYDMALKCCLVRNITETILFSPSEVTNLYYLCP